MVLTICILKTISIFCANLTKFQKNTNISDIGVFLLQKSLAKSKKMVYNCDKSGEKWILVVKSGKFPYISHRKGSENFVQW